MKKAYDVIIIGGGIIGCATAFELAKRGITDILLIEKRFLTSGATGRCGAGIRQQLSLIHICYEYPVHSADVRCTGNQPERRLPVC